MKLYLSILLLLQPISLILSATVLTTEKRGNLTLEIFNVKVNKTFLNLEPFIETFFIITPKLMSEFNPKFPPKFSLGIDLEAPEGIGYSGGGIMYLSPNEVLKSPPGVDWVTWAVACLLIDDAYSKVLSKKQKPSWFVDQLPDYATYLYCLDSECKDWTPTKFSKTEDKTYLFGGDPALKFLVWIENHYPGLVQKIHRTIVDSKYTVDVWQNETSKTIDDLWKDYTKNPTISRPKRAFRVNETLAAIMLKVNSSELTKPSNCYINGKPWFEEIDNTQCFATNLSLLLYNIGFSYLCLFTLTLTILISIFGGIKENYRWLILNQALWDLLITYSYLCENQAGINLTENENDISTCFYSFSISYYSTFWGYFLTQMEFFLTFYVHNNSYSSLLLLSLTRFICLYFMQFYEKLTRKRRIVYLILSFNVIFVFTALAIPAVNYGAAGRWSNVHDACRLQHCITKEQIVSDCNGIPEIDICISNDFWLSFLTRLREIFEIFNFLKAPICLLLSISAVFAITLKILKQMKFQYRHNKKDFLASARVAAVLVLQCLINGFVCIIEGIRNYGDMLFYVYGINVGVFTLGSFTGQNPDAWTVLVPWNLPPILDFHMGLTDPINFQAIKQLRVFLESIIVLAIMTGYRECIIGCFVQLYYTIRSPGHVYRKARNAITSSSNSVVSLK